MPETAVVVAAAVVERGDSYLVTRRLRGTHLEGLWEFPGGKCEPGETHAACLRREILEELGCGAEVGEKLLTVAHEYPERQRRTALLPLRHDRRAGAAARSGDALGEPRRAAQLEFPAGRRETIRLLAGERQRHDGH